VSLQLARVIARNLVRRSHTRGHQGSDSFGCHGSTKKPKPRSTRTLACRPRRKGRDSTTVRAATAAGQDSAFTLPTRLQHRYYCSTELFTHLKVRIHRHSSVHHSSNNTAIAVLNQLVSQLDIITPPHTRQPCSQPPTVSISASFQPPLPSHAHEQR